MRYPMRKLTERVRSIDDVPTATEFLLDKVCQWFRQTEGDADQLHQLADEFQTHKRDLAAAVQANTRAAPPEALEGDLDDDDLDGDLDFDQGATPLEQPGGTSPTPTDQPAPGPMEGEGRAGQQPAGPGPTPGGRSGRSPRNK